MILQKSASATIAMEGVLFRSAILVSSSSSSLSPRNSFPFLSFSSFHSNNPKPRNRFDSEFDFTDDVLTFFDHMVQMRPLPSVLQFNKFLTTTVSHKQYSTALSLIHKLDLLGSHPLVNPSLYSFNIAIDCYCRLGKVDFGFSVFGKIFKLGFQPCCVTFNTLISGLCQINRIGDALILFDEMKNSSGVAPDIVTFNTLIDSLCKNKKVNEALAMLKTMEATGMVPDIVTCNILIDSMFTAGKHEAAKKLFRDLPNRGLKPNLRTYNVMINGFCKMGKLSEAEEFLHEMKTACCSPDALTYNILLQGYLQLKDTSMAVGLLRDNSFSGTASTNILINELLSSESLDSSSKEIFRKFLGISTDNKNKN